MPKAAQRSPKTAIPTIIIEELLNLGFDRAEIDGVFKKIEEEIAGRKNRELENSSGTEKLSVYLLIAIVCLLLLGLLFQAVIGVIALSRFVMSLIGT